MEELFRLRMTSFRPSDENERVERGILGRFNGTGILSFQAFDLQKHGETLHNWSNKPYSAKFWNMAGSYEDFVAYYQQRMREPGIQHAMFFLNDQPLAFTETYPIIGSELEPYIQSATIKDFGIHFLMAPPRKIAEQFREFKRTISFFTLGQALRQLYRTHNVTNIYAEPDKDNHKACHLASVVGFKYVRDVVLSDKTAALYHLKKDDFRF